MIPQTEIVIRLLAAVGLGAAIGFERELKECPAGLRTHAIVALGSALFTIVSLVLSAPNVDISRIAAQVVVGIGFIGGGVIFKAQNKVVGITTAASLWAVAGVGLLAGIGDYFTATVGTAMTLGILVFGKLIEREVLHKNQKE